MNKPWSEASMGFAARSVAALVGVVALVGTIGDDEVPVSAACKLVILSFSAGSTRWDEMSMSPFSSVSVSE